MRLEQLRYFTQIAHDRSFTTAAENLYISQPSLSSSIASLEKELAMIFSAVPVQVLCSLKKAA